MTKFIFYIDDIETMKPCDIESLYNLIPNTFKSIDYMQGYLAALCFGKERVKTLENFEIFVNNRLGRLDNLKIKIIDVG